YYLGVDGISMPLVLLTTVIFFLSMIASWNIDRHVRGYCMLFLILETGVLGTFLALDFFLFFVFWEVMLLPMYFLIGIWGGPRREYAAIKFFLYTMLGSVFILIAMLGFYFTDVRDFVPKQQVDDRVAKLKDQYKNPGRRGPAQRRPCQDRFPRPRRPAGKPVVLPAGLADRVFPDAVRRLRHQGTGVPVPYLAARRACGSADANQHDPGWHLAQAR